MAYRYENCRAQKKVLEEFIMAEGKIFLKENRDRIEKKYREQMMGITAGFCGD